LFLTKAFTDTVEVIRDVNGGMFLDNQVYVRGHISNT
jgi:hypothetical protein